MRAAPLEPCDCTSYCGDDPRTDAGEVKPCRNYLDRQQIRRDAAEVERLLGLLHMPTSLVALRRLCDLLGVDH